MSPTTLDQAHARMLSLVQKTEKVIQADTAWDVVSQADGVCSEGVGTSATYEVQALIAVDMNVTVQRVQELWQQSGLTVSLVDSHNPKNRDIWLVGRGGDVTVINMTIVWDRSPEAVSVGAESLCADGGN